MKEVLRLYKQLHRTADVVFKGDERALSMAHQRIRNDFNKNKNVPSDTSIKELIQLGKDCDKVLREVVIQAELQPSGNYRANIREENYKFENMPFQDNISATQYRLANRKARQTCQNSKSSETS